MASLLRLAVGLSGQGQHVWDPPVKQCHSIGDYLLESDPAGKPLHTKDFRYAG
jgi:hypothetical protein